MRNQKNRLGRVREALDSLPITPASIDEGLNAFRDSGELPAHPRLAWAVTRQALYPRPSAATRRESAEWLRRISSQLVHAAHAPRTTERPTAFPPLTLREALFNEAIHDNPAVSRDAREAIKMLVSDGRDVTDPGFLPADLEDQGGGTVGEHVLRAGDARIDPDADPGSGLLLRVRASDTALTRSGPGFELSSEERVARVRALLATATARRAAAEDGN